MGDKMTTFKTPAPDAPAAEWGRLAVSIPRWRWPGSGTTELMDLRCIHMPEWEGYLLRLLGRDIAYLRQVGWDVDMTEPLWQWYDREPDDAGEHWSRSLSLYRAAISIAASIGRWPGGDS